MMSTCFFIFLIINNGMRFKFRLGWGLKLYLGIKIIIIIIYKI
jgi:hypothetical protein